MIVFVFFLSFFVRSLLLLLMTTPRERERNGETKSCTAGRAKEAYTVCRGGHAYGTRSVVVGQRLLFTVFHAHLLCALPFIHRGNPDVGVTRPLVVFPEQVLRSFLVSIRSFMTYVRSSQKRFYDDQVRADYEVVQTLFQATRIVITK